MKAAIYCRVSTSEQDIENQLLVLKDLAARRGDEVAQVYQEEETAWRAGHQHELAQLIRAARIGRFKIVYVWALDRLSRQGPLAIMTLLTAGEIWCQGYQLPGVLDRGSRGII